MAFPVARQWLRRTGSESGRARLHGAWPLVWAGAAARAVCSRVGCARHGDLLRACPVTCESGTVRLGPGPLMQTERRCACGRAMPVAVRACRSCRRRALRAARRECAVVEDARRSDQKAGRPGNDLTVEFAREMLTKPCSYCGDPAPKKMTLDRVDNRLAHTQSNVVTSCVRCNIVRGTMQLIAWRQEVRG